MTNDGVARARLLRRNQTDAERALWHVLRGRGLNGYKFRRQAPVGPYVVDFMCESARLVIEVDGGQHAERGAYDKARERFLVAGGYEVFRFWNNEVLANLTGVAEALTLALSRRERGRGAGTAPPTAGASLLGEGEGESK